MKILHVINTLETGGAESLVTQIIPLMLLDGFEVELVVFVGRDTPFFKKLISQGVKVHVFSQSGSVYNPRHILRLRKLIRNYDIVHTHNTSPQLFAAIACYKHSILCTTEHGGSNRRRAWKWYSKIDRWMYNKYKKIICISDKAESALREYIKSDTNRICTIYNGIDTQLFSEALPSLTLRNSLTDDAKLITMVAGFRWEKDQETLIRAMKFLPENFHLVLVGTGVRMDKCKSIAKEEGVRHRIIFTGLRTDIPNILKASDFIVMSSHFEGLSLSSLEGMAAGKPFFAADVDGLREVVSGAGRLFPHGDAKMFAEEILKVERNPCLYETIANQCQQRALQFDISRMVKEYEDVYY
ncbi:MAG: glycosyltransferase, partial [Muribaculaceae bacterium]|nr:glycosyltransferase [Muribaculaceae bacterium]